MSIPLDRLYHYLESIISDDIIIYRWSPHGSKKIDDLHPLATDRLSSDPKIEMFKFNMICHDQEPLDYNYYSYDMCFTKAMELAEDKKRMFPNVKRSWWHNDKFLDLLAKSHLRTALYRFMNFNDNILLCHSEKNSEQLKLYEGNGFVGVYYWAHGIIARDWYRYAEFDHLLTPDFDKITHDFLIYSRAWTGTREYRLKITELLIDNNLISNCKTAFSPFDSQTHYADHKFVNQSLSITRTDIENYIPMNTASSGASADYNSDDYTTSAIEIVLETLFDDSRLHLTEKTLRPIACGRPFVLVGTPGSLEYLRSYGFKTFAGLIDESYDTIQDPLLRLKAIVKELKRLSMLPKHDKELLWRRLYDIANYNKIRFFSREFHNTIIDEFTNNVNLGIEKCKQTTTGKLCSEAMNPAINSEEMTSTDQYIWATKWLEKNSPTYYERNFITTPSQSSPGSDSE